MPFVMGPADQDVLSVGRQAESLLGYPLATWSDVGSVEYQVRTAGGTVVLVTEVGGVDHGHDGCGSRIICLVTSNGSADWLR